MVHHDRFCDVSMHRASCVVRVSFEFLDLFGSFKPLGQVRGASCFLCMCINLIFFMLMI